MLSDEVRAFCAGVAARAAHVEIVPGATVAPGGIEGLDPALHFLDAAPDDVARYVLILDTVNFGSGWFDELATSTDALTQQLTEHARAERPWSAAALRALAPGDVAAVLGLPAAHELTALYARALNDLGAWLGDRPASECLGETAQELAGALARMPLFADRGFYKRAQIAPNDLVHAGVAAYPDVDGLTVFADNLLPHVLRAEGVLRYDEALAARVDGGELLAPGEPMEVELRACTVHACEAIAARLGVPPRTLDNWLWNRGRDLPGRPHRTRTVFY
jgi:hypothetical protein